MRVRERELGIVGRDVLEEQYIDIERARAKAQGAHTTVLALDALALVQQVQRLQARLQADHLVEERILIAALLRSGLVDAGRGDEGGGGQRRERFARGAQVPPGAEVGASDTKTRLPAGQAASNSLRLSGAPSVPRHRACGGIHECAPPRRAPYIGRVRRRLAHRDLDQRQSNSSGPSHRTVASRSAGGTRCLDHARGMVDYLL
jgi:hypothetical protein